MFSLSDLGIHEQILGYILMSSHLRNGNAKDLPHNVPIYSSTNNNLSLLACLPYILQPC
uniref:Uncharacterized protein n=1 Tax=Arundo donax TaxID=35708 RepID=A0A0A9N018_ARUDO